MSECRRRNMTIAIVLMLGVFVGMASAQFTKVTIDRTFRSEGVAVGDVNRDGKLDIMAGEVWYEGPDWTMHEILPPGTYDGSTGYSKTFANFACDVNRDGWVDSVITTMMGEPSLWYENPQNKPGHWKVHQGTRSACNETPVFADLLGDGKPVAVWAVQPEGYIAWFSIPEDPYKEWDMHIIGGPKAPGSDRYGHGLGVGDINGDGRNDVLVTGGWWEAPQDRTQEHWPFHAVDFGPPCADMIVYDVDGDGDNDVITSSAHDYGVWWFEQLSGENGPKWHIQEITKKYSQTHAIRLADMNNDGIMDFVTGKRYFAHNGNDPGSHEPPVVLWFEIQRPEGGKVKFVPHVIDDDSGIGTQFEVVDMNGDGRMDIVTANKKGVHLFLQADKEKITPDGVTTNALFDGKTFVGWEGNLDWFRVEDGAIVAGSLQKAAPRNEFLCTTKPYGDFELRLKVKLLGDPAHANAGIQIRSRRIPNHNEMIGYQADMGQQYWGCLYDESRRNKVLAQADAAAIAKILKPGDWNQYVIRCEGKRIQLWLNGVQTVDYTEPDAAIEQTGLIGLQIHAGPASEAWYKDIQIMELDSSKLGIFQHTDDVGAVDCAGATVFDPASGDYAITGSGENIWGTEDAFQFAWRKLAGDMALTADLRWKGEGKNAHRKAGWMIRQSLDAGSPYVDAVIHGDGLISLQYRKEQGGPTQEIQSPIRAPATLRLERHADVFSLSLSRDDKVFQPVGSLSVALTDPVYAGLVVCSHDNSVSETAVFSKVDCKALGQPKAEDRVVESTLEVLSVETGERRIVYREKRHFEAPNWSRDGHYLLFNGNGRLFTIPVEGGEPQLLDTGKATRCNNDHGFSPDGKWLAISDQSEGDSRIYVLPAAGGTPRQVTPLAPSYWHGWSPDGRTLAYCAARNGNYDIYAIPVEGGVEKRLTDAQGLDDGPDYSPDGRFIYFNSERTGLMKIWRMKADGSEQTQVTLDAEYADWFAHPSPDGKRLILLSYDKDVQGHPANKDVTLRIMAVPDGKPAVVARLFGGQGTINVPSWSPDSRFVAFVSYRLVAP